MNSLLIIFALLIGSHAYVVPYSPAHFNALGDFMDVYMHSHNDHVIGKIGTIFVKHGMVERCLSLQLLHTHFKIHDSEIIVERMMHNESVTAPVSMTTQMDISPYLFKFTRDGNVIPLEYVEHSEYVSREEMDRKISVIADNSTDFVKELVTFLISVDLIDIFGVGIPHRNHIGMLSGGRTTENSNAVERWYRVKPNPTKISTDSPVFVVKDCAHYCSSHLNGTESTVNAQVGWTFS